MSRDLIAALVVNLIGLLLYGGILSRITHPPLGLSSQQLMGVGLVFPLVAYIITYKKYPEQFWLAFFSSFATGIILAIGGFWLYVNLIL